MQIKPAKPAKFRFVAPGWKKDTRSTTCRRIPGQNEPDGQHVGHPAHNMSIPGQNEPAGRRKNGFITKARTCGRLLNACISAHLTKLLCRCSNLPSTRAKRVQGRTLRRCARKGPVLPEFHKCHSHVPSTMHLANKVTGNARGPRLLHFKRCK